ncbi:hypothetical protein H4582DRAFT_2127115 [Lactarius indigo]|nr:hypothetical protein H4582DRAFT_2127115 [Lactarius indigo]
MELPVPAGAGGAHSCHSFYEAADYSVRKSNLTKSSGFSLRLRRGHRRTSGSNASIFTARSLVSLVKRPNALRFLRASAALRRHYVQGPRGSMGNTSVKEGTRRWCREEVDDTMHRDDILYQIFARPLSARAKGKDFVQRGARAVGSTWCICLQPVSEDMSVYLEWGSATSS